MRIAIRLACKDFLARTTFSRAKNLKLSTIAALALVCDATQELDRYGPCKDCNNPPIQAAGSRSVAREIVQPFLPWRIID